MGGAIMIKYYKKVDNFAYNLPNESIRQVLFEFFLL